MRYAVVREAAEAGLKRWRRPQPTDVPLLFGVVRETGFPAAAIKEGTLGLWLKRSILAIEMGFTPAEAVASEAWRAGETLVQALVEPAVALSTVIVRFRQQLPPLHERNDRDPVLHLDSVVPAWRNDLPFDLEEGDFRSLVEDLVRTRRVEGGALAASRLLRRTAEGWAPRAELTLSGELDVVRTSPQLQAAMEGATRLRIFPRGDLPGLNRPIAVLEQVESDEATAWESRPLVKAFEVPARLNQAIRLAAVAGETLVEEFTAFAGEPVDAPVLLFQPDPGVDFENALELRFIGSSPFRSTRPWLAMAVTQEARSALKFEHPPSDLGDCILDGRCLLAFVGQASLDLGDGRLTWRSAAEREDTKRLILTGETLRRVRETVFLGTPKAWLSDGQHHTLVSSEDLIWRSLGRGSWRSSNKHAPLGRVEIAMRRGGELVAWTCADVAPRELVLSGEPRTHSLKIENLLGASVAAKGGQILPISRNGDDARVDLRLHTPGAMLHVALRWDTQLDLTLADPIAEPLLLTPDMRPAVSRAQISIDRLHGFRLLAPGGRDLWLVVRQGAGQPVQATRRIDGLVPLSAFQDELRDLLGSFPDLDAEVRLSWAGRGDHFAEIAWYDEDQPLVAEKGISPFSGLSSILGWNLDALALTQPTAKLSNNLPRLSLQELQTRLLQELGPGPWLIFGRTNDGTSLRPKVVAQPPGDDDRGSALRLAFRIARRDARDDAFATVLKHPEALNRADLRLLVDLSVAARDRNVPVPAIDALRSLCRAPQAAPWILSTCDTLEERDAVIRLQSELPFLWCATEVEHWVSAFRTRIDELERRLERLELPTADAGRNVAAALGQIADLEPGLATHAWITFLLVAPRADLEPGLIGRLCRRPKETLRELAEAFVTRQSEHREPPTGLHLAGLLPERRELWERYDPAFADLIAAPLVAARMAAGKLHQNPQVVGRCRAAWLHDRQLFESALAVALGRETIDPGTTQRMDL
ncbi:hypothetical protein EN859_021780 [Mesorhizobium sp. M00.F.Ca.ET.216.01.1.1]|nr:hypothetical protein EN859_021780 [Mesorhizobium sp. M00.F.Ca.ET.216.01.1.1]